MFSKSKYLIFQTFLVVFLVLFAAIAFAATEIVRFQWDPNTEADLKGYRLYKSATAGGPYTFVGKNPATDPANPPASYIKTILAPAVTTDVTLTAPDGSKLYFVLTAYDNDGNESGKSNEASYTFSDQTSPAPPKGLIARLLELLSWIFERWGLRAVRVG